jgi:type VI secretion system protein ImpH
MTVNFFGLGGPSGPLPPPFSEWINSATVSKDAFDPSKKDTAARDFLDLFHHRLIALLFRLRQMHQPPLTAAAPHRGDVARYLFALIGLGAPTLRHRLPMPDRVLLKDAGLFIQRPRSAAGLERVLHDFFDVPVKVKQFTGMWLSLDRAQTTVLASPGSRVARNNALGQGVVLGSRVWDQSRAVTIRLGPMSMSRFLSFLPDPAGGVPRALACLTSFYLGPQRSAHFELILESQAVAGGMVGSARLGYTSFLVTRRYAGTDPIVPISVQN